MKIVITKRILEQFWSKVEDISNKTIDDCWNWTGSLDSSGYGILKITIRKYTQRIIGAHRLSYLIFNGLLDDTLVVTHDCDNPTCINYFHLKQKTMKENSEDCIKRGRLNSQNKNITQCPYGHEYTPENTIIYQGSRHCRKCKYRRNKERRFLGLR